MKKTFLFQTLLWCIVLGLSLATFGQQKTRLDGNTLSAANNQNNSQSQFEVPDAATIVRYDDGINDNSIGLTAGGSFEVSARFRPDQLGALAGQSVTQVEIFINDGVTDVVVKIYGAGSPTLPGPVLYSQSHPVTTLSWNLITLSTPVFVDGTDLWVGYEVTHSAGTFPAGLDETAPLDFDGDWIYLSPGPWEHLGALGLPGDWNIAAYVEPTGPPCPIDPPTNPSPANGAVDVPISGNTATWTNGAGTEQNEVWFGEVGNLAMVYDGTPIESFSLAPVEPLAYGTTYGWRVVGKNDTCDVSGPTWNFKTVCGIITSFPYAESFDGTTFPPTCWANTQVSGTGLWKRVTTGTYPTCTPHSGAGMTQYNSFSYSAGAAAILVTPEITFPSAAYEVSFWMYRDPGYATNADRVEVYYNTTPDLTGATLLGTINRSMTLPPVVAAAGWYQYRFNVPGGTSGNAYILFDGISQYGNNMYVDDIVIDQSCLVTAPFNPSPANGATGVPITGVTLGWTNGSGTTDVEVWFGPSGNATKVYDGVAKTSHALGTLTYFSAYQWWIVCKNATCSTQGPLWSFTTVPPAGANLIMLVSDNTVGTDSVQAWLVALGETYTRFTNTAAMALPTSYWLDYDAVMWIGVSSGAESDSAIAYCNGGGNILAWDNDQGYSTGTGSFFQNYLMALYQTDAGSDGIITGLDIMDGLSMDISADPYPDDVLPNTGTYGTGVPIFLAPTTTTYAGMRAAGGPFRTQLLCWDPQFGDSRTTNLSIVRRTIDWLADGIVPVELTSFSASVNETEVTLNWITATETNNQGFEVQRSNGGEFETIAFVEGHGTTTEVQAYSYADRNVKDGSYSYRLKQVDFDGTFEYSNVVEVDVSTPKVFALDQNYPNPFNPSTKIAFRLAVDSKVSLKIFDILGQEVATLVNTNLVAGAHNVDFNASLLNSGVYFYRIEATGISGTNFVDVKKMILTK